MTNQNETTPTDPRLQSRPETSRQNGAKSNGPVSPQGKANSSRNATKHGFLARTIVLPNESPKRFARLLKSLRTQLQPANEVEKDIVDCMAVARWRRLRARGLERAIIGYESKNRAPEFTDLAPTEHSPESSCPSRGGPSSCAPHPRRPVEVGGRGLAKGRCLEGRGGPRRRLTAACGWWCY